MTGLNDLLPRKIPQRKKAMPKGWHVRPFGTGKWAVFRDKEKMYVSKVREHADAYCTVHKLQDELSHKFLYGRIL